MMDQKEATRRREKYRAARENVRYGWRDDDMDGRAPKEKTPNPLDPAHEYRDYGASPFPMRMKRGVMTTNLFHGDHGSFIDSSLSAQVTQKFIADQTEDVFAAKFDISIDKSISLKAFCNTIKKLMTGARAVMPYEERAVVIHGAVKGHPAMLWLQLREHDEAQDISITLHTHPDVIDDFKASIEASFEKQKLAKVTWCYNNGNHVTSRNIYMPPLTTQLRSEFYPDLNDPNEFLNSYMASDASVLLMAGAPGTGKTTMLRHLIVDRKLSAQIVYDEGIMEKDSLFHNFLFDDEAEIMVIEDADTILSPRENSGNKMMARFLSVSDGLIKLPNKKLIFTTNLTDFGRVDQALLRPGRCFGVIHTRALTLTEAQAAAKVANLPMPIEKREYTIAELFNQGQKVRPRRVGFGFGG